MGALSNMIPKILHQIWIGTNPIPEKEKRWIKSWKDLHPSWEHMMWTNENIHTLDVPSNCLEALENAEGVWSCQADILRYIATLRHGGVYIDSDIECYKPIDELITDQLEFLGLKPRPKANWITTAFYGVTRNHPLSKSLVEGVVSPEKEIVQGERFAGKSIAWGPQYINRMYLKYVSGGRPGERPVEELQSSKEKILSPSFWGLKNPNAYCRHYFNASWM